jgi:ubiquinone/menaquinone biosynthesis C-methylase UbiE
MESKKTAWGRDKRTHFDEIISNYDRVRPEYPPELFADVMKYAGGGKKALEIGAGTGKATRPFLDAGFDVTAVDAGAGMAEFIREKFKDYKNFNVIHAAFEDAVLDENNYGLIYAASAIHWVDASIGCPKIFKLLKNGGIAAFFRHSTVPVESAALFNELNEVYKKYYGSYYSHSDRPSIHNIGKPDGYFWTPHEIKRGYGFEDMKEFGFEDISMKLYKQIRKFTADEYLDFEDTMADHRSLPEENRTALYAGIKNAILKDGGSYTMEFVFQLYMGRKP